MCNPSVKDIRVTVLCVFNSLPPPSTYHSIQSFIDLPMLVSVFIGGHPLKHHIVYVFVMLGDE